MMSSVRWFLILCWWVVLLCEGGLDVIVMI